MSLLLLTTQSEGRWSELGTQIRELNTIPPEFIPTSTHDEITLARHELENTNIITELSNAVQIGCISGES
jgi:hypothetical protein